jgi:hypothetical protein
LGREAVRKLKRHLNSLVGHPAGGGLLNRCVRNLIFTFDYSNSGGDGRD